MAVIVNTPEVYKKYPVRMTDKGRYTSKQNRVDVTTFHLNTQDPIAFIAGETDVAETLAKLIYDLKVNGLIPPTGNTYNGTVLYEDEVEAITYIENAKVFIQEYVLGGTSEQHFKTIATVKTDANGEFSVEGLFPGYPYNFLVEALGYEDYDAREEYGQAWLLAEDGVSVTSFHHLVPLM